MISVILVQSGNISAYINAYINFFYQQTPKLVLI